MSEGLVDRPAAFLFPALSAPKVDFLREDTVRIEGEEERRDLGAAAFYHLGHWNCA